ncbi:MAG: hypothetical protein ABIJ09_21465 [Pseudomonadota bacterium]
MTQTRPVFSALTLLPIAGMVLCMPACDPTGDDGTVGPGVAAPGIAPIGTSRFGVGGEGDTTEDAAGSGEECTARDGGGWDCLWDDGAGTLCSYTVDADELLLAQECSGPWGQYSCLNGGAQITCTLTSERGSCVDTYDLEYQLSSSTCDDDILDPVENCEPQSDGTTLCLYDDGVVQCEVWFAPDDSFLSQQCSDGSWNYDCLAQQGVILCDLVVDGELLCQDSYTPEGEPLDLGCEAYVDEPDDRGEENIPDDVMQSCTPQDDGGALCLYDDGETQCEVLFDGSDNLVWQHCSDGTWSYDCMAEAEVVNCTLFEGEVELCQDSYTLDGTPVLLGCEDLEPADPGTDEPRP